MTTGQFSSGTSDDDPVVRARYPGRWIAAAAILIMVLFIGRSMMTNPGYQWDVVLKYLTFHTVLKGLAWTLGLTAAAMSIGMVLGIVAALMRQSSNPVLSVVAATYIWLFRGVPLLVQLIFWYNLAALYPQLELGLPFLSEPIFSAPTNEIITPLVAALLGLGLNEGAYLAEIVRGGLLSVDPGQREAAQSLGMTPAHTFRRIILPQAMRVIVPPTGNELIGMLKATSLVSILSLSELLYSVQAIYGRTFETIPLLIVAAIWYLVAATVLSVGQSMLESRYGRGHSFGHGDGLSLLLDPFLRTASQVVRRRK